MTAPIPRLLHYCWFGGGPKSGRIRRCMDSWARLLPDWEIVEWNEDNFPVDDAYSRAAAARGMWAMIADYARLLALHEHGGIYLDTDVELRRDLEPLRRHACVLGFQTVAPQDDWVNNAVLGARPGHPFLEACAAMTLAHFRHAGEFARSPAVTTHVLRAWGLREYGYQEVRGVTLYPTTAFYPYPWTGRFDESCVTPDTYAVHHWENSWRRPTPLTSAAPSPPPAA